MKEKIEITKATITVKCLQVDGKQMTKCTFRQIETIDSDDRKIPIAGFDALVYGEESIYYRKEHNVTVLGWVYDLNEMWLVWIANGAIYRGLIGDDPGSITLVKRKFDQLFIAT